MWCETCLPTAFVCVRAHTCVCRFSTDFLFFSITVSNVHCEGSEMCNVPSEYVKSWSLCFRHLCVLFGWTLFLGEMSLMSLIISALSAGCLTLTRAGNLFYLQCTWHPSVDLCRSEVTLPLLNFIKFSWLNVFMLSSRNVVQHLCDVIKTWISC